MWCCRVQCGSGGVRMTPVVETGVLQEGEVPGKPAYERPTILWEETLEIAGTLRASNVPGQNQCGDQGMPPPFPGGGW